MVNLFSFIEDYLVDKEDGIRQLGYFFPIPPKCILRNEKHKISNIYIPKMEQCALMCTNI